MLSCSATSPQIPMHFLPTISPCVTCWRTALRLLECTLPVCPEDHKCWAICISSGTKPWTTNGVQAPWPSVWTALSWPAQSSAMEQTKAPAGWCSMSVLHCCLFSFLFRFCLPHCPNLTHSQESSSQCLGTPAKAVTTSSLAWNSLYRDSSLEMWHCPQFVKGPCVTYGLPRSHCNALTQVLHIRHCYSTYKTIVHTIIYLLSIKEKIFLPEWSNSSLTIHWETEEK